MGQYPSGVETPVSDPLVSVDNAVMYVRRAGLHLKHIEHYAVNDKWTQERVAIMAALREALGKLNEAGESLVRLERVYRQPT